MPGHSEWMARALTAESRVAELEAEVVALRREIRVRVAEVESRLQRFCRDIEALERQHDERLAEMRDDGGAR